MANGAIDLTTMPSALLARRLRSRLWCQKQVVAGHRGRSLRNMPLLSIITICATLILCSCDRAPTAYQRLREETGASDHDLQQGIRLYTEFYISMRKEIDAGNLTVKDMIDASKQAKVVMETIKREDELSALYSLKALQLLEKQGPDAAEAFLVGRLYSFKNAKVPMTQNSEDIRKKIELYSKDSPAFQKNKISEQTDAPNHHAFGTFVTDPADAGSAPKASGGR